ncbi:ImmA/IrrE family metallo-endopeptidase [Cupriavidus sp. KB_39]|uniref:ImmA/IrrE family metallo-endopeptidase n=1 Tax=Cupriavidus sp. KB_39 TaxID=3233036 RepID=UPI003F92955D
MNAPNAFASNVPSQLVPPVEYSSPTACNLSKRTVSMLAETVAKNLGFENHSDLEELVNRLGGEITYQDVWDLESSESGSIEIRNESDFSITLAAHTSRTRDRFTIAHELGHYFLHYRLPKVKGAAVGPIRAARYGGDRAEIEANWFAASFLMPEARFRSIFEQYGGDHRQISEFFGVSVSASTVRAKSLGLG